MEKEAQEGEKPPAAKEEEKKPQKPTAPKKQQQDDDDERYDTVAKIKLVYEGKCVKGFRVTGNLNRFDTRMITANITPHIEMTVKVIYSFKSMIYWGGSKIQSYSKALDLASSMFTSLKEIQAYIEECE